MNYSHVIFDLDDTLIDTTGQLIPIAINILKDILLSYEISITADELQELRKRFYASNPRGSFNSHLVNVFFPNDQKSEVIKKLQEAFYNIPLPKELSLTPGAIALLKNLKQDLFLVTSGSQVTQEKKIFSTGLNQYFKAWHCASEENSHSKLDIFQELTEDLNCKKILVIGNRIDNEILAANKLGLDSCLLQFGEYRFLTPINSLEEPTYTIQHLDQVRELCKQ